VPKHLGDYLGVHVAGKQERCARVPEVVKAKRLRETGALQEWFEAVLGDEPAVQGQPGFRGEYEAVLLPQGARAIYLPNCRFRWP
jgi:hypothetical protein